MKSSMLAVLVLALAACTSQRAPPPPATTSVPGIASTAPRPRIGIPNPASVNCTEQGGRVDLRRDPAGIIYGVCLLPDGRECEEWALFRNRQCVAPPRPTTAGSALKP
ncbi:putative hemolysin [Dyella sp. Tek66A03]|uniref:putative hemolysin n=1 Tax=Dyella sp. Tek66A03 TaxID=3458298 RepID=UPI00403EE0A2